MLNVGECGCDVCCFVWDMECWIIVVLVEFNVYGEICDGCVGVWVLCFDKFVLFDGI